MDLDHGVMADTLVGSISEEEERRRKMARIAPVERLFDEDGVDTDTDGSCDSPVIERKHGDVPDIERELDIENRTNTSRIWTETPIRNDVPASITPSRSKDDDSRTRIDTPPSSPRIIKRVPSKVVHKLFSQRKKQHKDKINREKAKKDREYDYTDPLEIPDFSSIMVSEVERSLPVTGGTFAYDISSDNARVNTRGRCKPKQPKTDLAVDGRVSVSSTVPLSLFDVNETSDLKRLGILEEI